MEGTNMELQLSNMSYHPATWYSENGGNVNFLFTITTDPGNIPQTVIASVEIYDENGPKDGELIATLSQEIPTNGSPFVNASLEWDGTDSTGAEVDYGRYAPRLGASAEGYENVIDDFCSGIGKLPGCSQDPEKKREKEPDEDECVVVENLEPASGSNAGGPKLNAPSPPIYPICISQVWSNSIEVYEFDESMPNYYDNVFAFA